MFNKKSVFYESKDGKFQEKKTTLKMIASSGPDVKGTVLGETTFDITTYVGKVHEKVEMPLPGGACPQNSLKFEISIVL